MLLSPYFVPGHVLGGGGTEMPAPGPRGRSPLSVGEKNSCHSVERLEGTFLSRISEGYAQDVSEFA